MKEKDWRKYLNNLRTKDVATLEFLIDFAFYDRNLILEKPLVASVEVNKESTLALFWYSDDDRKTHFYPIVGPNCREAECIPPFDWEVIFLGSLKQLKESQLASKMEKLPIDNDGVVIAILITKPYMGFDGKNMANSFFPCSVITIAGKDNILAQPKKYMKEEWA